MTRYEIFKAVKPDEKIFSLWNSAQIDLWVAENHKEEYDEIRRPAKHYRTDHLTARRIILHPRQDEYDAWLENKFIKKEN